LILDYFAYELRAARAEPFKRLVDVVHGEHDAEVAQGVDRGVAVICDDRRREEAGELEPAVAVRRAHHGNLDMLIAQSRDTSGPFSFDRGPPFELEAEFAKEINRPFEVLDDDSYIVHPLERHGIHRSNHLSYPAARSGGGLISAKRGRLQARPSIRSSTASRRRFRLSGP
jgi:hypothetical protein